jgi:pimeloyl-ACP methyl ester carboxylesterase
MKIDALRTSDERFRDLPGFSFEPHYLEDLVGGLRMHYLDEGPRDAARTFLCLHGQPTWSYLYRKMIPVFTAAGHRVVAPDFFGFGRSDKPTEDAVYTFTFHRDALVRFIERMDFRNITLVCQDWGGLLGLTLPMDMPERITRLFVMNTALATGQVDPGPGFKAWKEYVANNPDFSIAKLMKQAVANLSDAECAAYEAPYPDVRHRGGARRFPLIVPVDTSMDGAEISQRAAAWLSSEWSGQTFIAAGKNDPVLGIPAMMMLSKIIRGCPEPLIFENAGHFVQEAGAEVAEAGLASESFRL